MQSRGALGRRFLQLRQFAPGFRSFVYPDSSRIAPATFVADQIARHGGCKNVALYLAGGGYSDATAVNVGMGVGGGKVAHQDVTLADLRGLATAHPGVTFEFVVDAPHASGFHALTGLANVLLVATPSAPGGGSFTYLPEARVGGALIANDTNPLHLLQFTDRLVFGLDRAIDDSCEVSQLQSSTQSGKLRSALAYLLARGFAGAAALTSSRTPGSGRRGRFRPMALPLVHRAAVHRPPSRPSPTATRPATTRCCRSGPAVASSPTMSTARTSR